MVHLFNVQRPGRIRDRGVMISASHFSRGSRRDRQFVRELCFCRYAISPSIPPDASWLLNWPW